MKAFKITVVSVVIMFITFFMMRSIVNQEDQNYISSPSNQFTQRIEFEIDSFEMFPKNVFCNIYYSEVLSRINEFYRAGKFGNTEFENKQLNDNYIKRLYSKYTELFISQVYYIFRNSEWKQEDLKLIKNEISMLKTQKLNNKILLEDGTPTDDEFHKIEGVLKKYDEIVNFIATNKQFSYTETDLMLSYPISKVDSILSRSKYLLNNKLENAFVNNCNRLKDELREMPQVLFNEHVKYLDNKIRFWSGKYSNYSTQAEYRANLYDNLKNEINSLDNNLYSVSSFNDEYARISRLLDKDSAEAYKYFSSKIKPNINQ